MAAAVIVTGCGTTRWTDSPRTATEQLVVSTAIDEAVSELDFSILAGKKVYFDKEYIDVPVDRGYLIGAIRQQLLACGCLLQSKREDADYVVEARCGALGTDRHDLLFGMPQISLPTFLPMPGIPAQIPELTLAKKTKQIGAVRLSVYAYNRHTGQGVWQSGIAQKSTTAKNLWVFGAGPFERGPHRQGMSFAGERLRFPLIADDDDDDEKKTVDLDQEIIWADRPVELAAPEQQKPADDPGAVKQASATVQAPAPDEKPGPSPSTANDGQQHGDSTPGQSEPDQPKAEQREPAPPEPAPDKQQP